MKKKIILSLILIFVIGVDVFLVLYTQPKYQNNIHQVIPIEVNDDYSNLDEYFIENDKTYNIEELEEDVTKYSSGAELGCLKIVFKAFNKDFDLEESPANHLEGRMHPLMFCSFAREFCKNNDWYMFIKNISGLSINELQTICKNGWLVQVWYSKDLNENIEQQFRWQKSNVGIITNIDNDIVYLIDSQDGLQEYPINEFRDMWEYSGSYAILYK